MFLKGNENVEGNEDLLFYQSFEVNFKTENNGYIIKLFICIYNTL